MKIGARAATKFHAATASPFANHCEVSKSWLRTWRCIEGEFVVIRFDTAVTSIGTLLDHGVLYFTLETESPIE